MFTPGYISAIFANWNSDTLILEHKYKEFERVILWANVRA